MFSNIRKIYENYKKELKIAQKFYLVTSCSYNLCTTLSDEDIRFDSRVLENKPSRKNISYSPAETEYVPTLLCEWVTILEYSHRENISFEEVEKNAKKGVYGEVINDEEQEFIIWPSKYQFSDKKPEFGKKLYAVEMKPKVKVKTEISDEDLKGYIKVAFKDLNKTTSEAQEILNRETYLLYWAAFEQYVKQMALVLFEIFPDEVFKNKKYGKETMSFSDIFIQSKKFTNIDELRDYILSSIIGLALQGNKDSVSKTIQFIRDCFIEKSKDPYVLWYVYEGERYQTSYVDIDNIRNIRNALVHENGNMSKGLIDNSLLTEQGDTVIISEKLLEREFLILETIGYNLYQCIKAMDEKKK